MRRHALAFGLAILTIVSVAGGVRARVRTVTLESPPLPRLVAQASVRCVSLTHTGQQCRNYARRGTSLCRVHTP